MLFNQSSFTIESINCRVHRQAAFLAMLFLMLMLAAPSQSSGKSPYAGSSEMLMAGFTTDDSEIAGVGDLISAMLNNYVPNDLRSVLLRNENSSISTITAPVSPDINGIPLCTDTLYGANTAGVLHTININTAVATVVGTMPTSPSTEIEYDPATGRAFSQTGGFEFNGHEFDIVNASGIGSFIPTAHTYTGLEWVGSTLYGASINGPQGASTLRILDPWTGTNTTIGLTGFGPLSGLAYHAPTGIMYGIEGGGGTHELVRVNLTSGVATSIGVTGIVPGSLEFGPNGLLYAGGSSGQLYTINTTTGAATLVGQTGIGTISGLANACSAGPTPTPTPTNTPTATPTNTPTATPTNTPTATPTNTPTATPTNTPTATPTNTPTATPTNTPTATPTNTPTATPTNTPTPTPTPFPEYDLTISQADSPDPVFAGRLLTYTLTVTNTPVLGGGACPEVRFKFPSGVPIELVFASGTNGYVATPTANGLSFTGGCVNSNNGQTATATITIVIRPLAAGTLTSVGTDVVVDPTNVWAETNENNNFASTIQTTVLARPVTTTFDYDGDHKSDISVYRPSMGNWYLQLSTSGFVGFNFGISTDKIAPADYDGDSKTDIAVYRPSTGIWYITNSSNGSVTYFNFGTAEDLPTPADYDGDGRADISVFRPSTGIWYRQNSSNGAFIAFQFGANGDVPTIGDFDGDGSSDIAVFRPSTGAWYQFNSSNGTFYGEQFGISTDRIAPADYDGDGKTDIAIYRPSEGLWYIKNSGSNTYTPYVFGLAQDFPVPADYDGDGEADIGVFRPTDGTWYIVNSTNGGFTILQFGQNGDNPTQHAFGN